MIARAFLLLGISFLLPGLLHAAPARKTDDFNGDWRFAVGDDEEAADIDFDDSDWQPVRLPHDWAIAGPFDPKATGKITSI